MKKMNQRGPKRGARLETRVRSSLVLGSLEAVQGAIGAVDGLVVLACLLLDFGPGGAQSALPLVRRRGGVGRGDGWALGVDWAVESLVGVVDAAVVLLGHGLDGSDAVAEGGAGVAGSGGGHFWLK